MAGLLAAAITGGGQSRSQLGNALPSAAYQESGMSPEQFAKKTRQHHTNPEDARGLNKATDEVLEKRVPQSKDDPHKVVVANLLLKAFGKSAGMRKSLLSGYLGNLDANESYGMGSSSLMPKDMPQAGRLEHPEYFFHDGFEPGGGTESRSAGGAVDHSIGIGPGADTYESYARDKELRDAMIQSEIKKKTAALIIKLGLAAPPGAPVDAIDAPNGPDDINTDQDAKRAVQGAMNQGPTHYPRYHRANNLAAAVQKRAAEFSAGFGAASKSLSDGFKLDSKPVKQDKDKSLKITKPRKSVGNVEYSRQETSPFQELKVPKGVEGADPAMPDAKTAALLKKVFRWA